MSNKNKKSLGESIKQVLSSLKFWRSRHPFIAFFHELYILFKTVNDIFLTSVNPTMKNWNFL